MIERQRLEISGGEKEGLGVHHARTTETKDSEKNGVVSRAGTPK